MALAGHVVIQRALAQLKLCVFCDGHVAAAERGGIIRRQRTAVNDGVAVVVRRVAEDERAIAFFGQRFAVPAARYGGNLTQLAGNFKRFIIAEGEGAARFANGSRVSIPTELLLQNEVGVIVSVNVDAEGQVIWQ